MLATRTDKIFLLALLATAAEGFVQHPFHQPNNKKNSLLPVTTPLTKFQRLLSQRDDNDDPPMVSLVQEEEEEDDDDDGHNPANMVSEDRHIPITGISVGDAMEAAQSDFVTEVVPIEGLPGVAQLVTNPVMQYSFEPVRYLVALSPPKALSTTEETIDNEQSTKITYENATFAMVDVPPFSQELATQLKTFMGVNSKLVAILSTSSDAIHFDEAPTQMYAANRRAALIRQWIEVFPEASVITCRLDTPRDCQSIVNQKLDGMGPFGWDEQKRQFLEMGQPLQLVEWDFTTSQQVMNGQKSPEAAEESMAQSTNDTTAEDKTENSNDDPYSPAAIRKREEGRKILAVCTPGHSYGSLSFVFPETKVCCSGYTIPVEDNRAEENVGFAGAGPFLDARGYITNSQAGITRQMESARRLVSDYGDRFSNVLPSRGDPLMLDGNTKSEQNEILVDIIDQYDRIGQIYEQLGITTATGEDGYSP